MLSLRDGIFIDSKRLFRAERGAPVQPLSILLFDRPSNIKGKYPYLSEL